jgi:hypothetical protein
VTDPTAGIRADIQNHYGPGSPALALLLATLINEEHAGAQRLSADGIRRVAAARGWSDWAADYIDPDVDFDKESVEAEHCAREAAHKAVRDLHHPVTLMGGVVCCNECSGQRRTGLRTYERTAYIPHPCRTIQALNGEEL